MPGQESKRSKGKQPEQREYRLEQGLPANVDAERTILGSVILNPEVIHEVVAAGVQELFFSLDSNRRIFCRMRDMAAESQPIDIITLADKLARRNEVEIVGGVAYLSSLTDGLPHRVSVDRYIAMLREAYQRRAVIFACNKTISMVMEPAQDVTECIGGLSDELLTVKADTITHPARRIGEIARESLKEIEAQMYAAREIIGLETGVQEFDLSTTGIRKGEVFIVGGYPGSGKTSFVTQIMLDNARVGVPTLLFSLEMKQAAVAKRCFSLYTEISATLIRNPRHLHTSDFRLLEESLKYFDAIPFWIDDRCGQDVAEIIARARLWIRKNRKPQDADKPEACIGLDFAQLMKAAGENQNEQITAAMKAIADTAKETDVPWVVLSQLVRPEGRDPNARPNMFMLRGSGAIEQFGHLIAFTYRPVSDKSEPTGDDELIIGKQREGVVGSIPAEFDKRSLRWRERKPEEKKPEDTQGQLALGEAKKAKTTKVKKGAKDGDGANQNPGTETQSQSEGLGLQDPETGD